MLGEQNSSGQGRDPVDRSVLAEMCGGDEAFERRILGNFRVVTKNDAAKLRDAVANGDLPQVVRVSHSIKGASRTIGAQDLAAVCDRLESAGRAAEASTIARVMPAFGEEIDRIYVWLDSLLGSETTTAKGSKGRPEEG